MGSTGSGRFSDYSGVIDKGDGSGGGTSGTDRCTQAFTAILEEVAQCEYYEAHQKIPATGTLLKLQLDRRIFAVDAQGLKVGVLPTSYNYLAACIKSGIDYIGVIKASSANPIPQVEVDFSPEEL